MEYVHELDDEITENLKQMLTSVNPEDIKLAIEILNHVDLSHSETKYKVLSLILDAQYGLGISFGQARLRKNDIKAFSNNVDYYMEEEPNKENFKFYSINLI